jgi:hypothetical protein
VDKKNSGVGVLDKAVTILGTLESGPHSLAELVAVTGIARPTAHRLAVALEHHRLVTRDLQGRFVLGPRSAELSAAAGEDRAIEKVLEISGRWNPNAQSVEDARVVVMTLVEAIIKYVPDPEVRAKIMSEVSLTAGTMKALNS